MFSIGQSVFVKAASSRKGVIIEIIAGNQIRYRVFHSATDIVTYFEEQLAPEEILVVDPFVHALQNEQFVDVDQFRAYLTATRLAHPLTSNLYALHAARINFIPFQFKPLMRILRSDRPRLLIADEVGVGKTIEAGLILKELQTRQKLDNVLIVCPKALVKKWRMEMQRFDEDFQILTPESLKYCIEETHLDGCWPVKYNKAIVNLELLRNDTILTGQREKNGLLTLDPPPHFDLLIVDEAHHLRNPDTNSFTLARFLCDIAEAVVFLSATPLQTGAHNLFTLLHLLRDDLFQDQQVFQSMIEPNAWINEAIRLLRSQAENVQIHHSLLAAGQTPWGQQSFNTNEVYHQWITRLSEDKQLDTLERIQGIRDLEELHTLSYIINRTRRRDIGRFTLREPHTVSVPFTAEQQLFYEQLINIRHRFLEQEYGPFVARMIIDTLERQASSCLPAMVIALENVDNSIDFSAWTDVDDEVSSTVSMNNHFHQLQQTASQLSDDDPKFDRLVEIVDTIIHNPASSRKILIFSFFLNTLNYLRRRLIRRGYRVELITGQTLDDERENLRSRFALPQSHPQALDILLSSEVGCEGLDYQFCDCLVNYDIPWNPMRIEQRIGRIDRYGQQSDKVLIYNFITPGTVEERIYYRCFERLGIFNNTLGDLEEILGEMMNSLENLVVDVSLSPQQSNLLVQQMADNALRKIEEQRRLDDEGIFSAQSLNDFSSDVQELEDQGRYVSANDLQHLLSYFLRENGGKLIQDSDSIFHLRLNKDGREGLLEALRQIQSTNKQVRTLRNWLEGDKESLVATFDQSTAVEQRHLDFITPVHPLIQIAASQYKNKPLITSITVPAEYAATYLVVVELWESIAIQSEVHLHSFAWNLSTDTPQDLPVIQILANSETYNGGRLLQLDTLQTMLQKLDDHIYSMRDVELEALKQKNQKRVERQLNSLKVYYDNRLSQIRRDLQQATESRIKRMKTSEFERVQRDYNKKSQAIENRRNVDIVTTRIALVLLSTEAE